MPGWIEICFFFFFGVCEGMVKLLVFLEVVWSQVDDTFLVYWCGLGLGI